MDGTVLGPAQLQDISSKTPKDSVSKIRGNRDGFSYCGERKFRITSTGHEDYLSYSELLTTLTLMSTKDSEIGTNIPITIQAYLVNYSTRVVESNFFVTITACEVISLTAMKTLD
mmetsp:Transcript_290/g.399  ORF Transcript_290/g.399 Transcript_290/m.399 type:complete len:115 (-) Transcript_290:164-508(-)